MIKHILFAALAAIAMSVYAQAQSNRPEVVSIETVTLSDSDILSGRTGKSVSVKGNLRVPQSGGGRFPAAILLHGSGGVGGPGSSIDEWTRELSQLGIATLSVDSFTGRSIKSTVMDQTQLSRLNMAVDAYRALDLLAKDARIDPTRIAVIGFSRGGQSALYSALGRLSNTLASSNVRFAAHVAFYPDCTTTYLDETNVSDVPIRIFHGSADTWNGIAPCRAYVERLKQARRNIEVLEYANAHHAFDSPLFRKPVVVKGAPTTRKCELIESVDHQVLNRQTKKPFTYRDGCIAKDPTVAFNEVANRQARADLREFLTKVFNLKL